MSLAKKLFKFEPFNSHSLTKLKNQQIFFSSPKNFNDPFDCAIGFDLEDISEPDLIKMHNHYLSKCPDKIKFIGRFGSSPNDYFKKFLHENLKKILIATRETVLSEHSIACFSEVNNEILMWSHYSDKHTGFCLEFDTNYEPFRQARKVSYSKYLPKINPSTFILEQDSGQIMKMFSTKYKCWAYEKEWRIFNDEANKLYSYPAESLVGIYFGSKMPFAHMEIIALIMQRQNPDVALYLAEKSETMFIVNFNRFEYTY